MTIVEAADQAEARPANFDLLPPRRRFGARLREAVFALLARGRRSHGGSRETG